MNIGVILNRVFRINNNPLFEYINQQKDDIDKCYLIIPKETFEEEGTDKKANYYYGTLEKFLYQLKEHHIEPYVINYSELGMFCTEHDIKEIVMAGDIMSYHQDLTKDLFIDWAWGEDYFRKKLIDYDAASNVHGWQWSASTGTDAVPYFRMFNPTRQSERFDKDALYIKKYIPIFDHVPAKFLHHPFQYQTQLVKKGIQLGEDYPKPIVDHKVAREYVMTIFKNI